MASLTKHLASRHELAVLCFPVPCCAPDAEICTIQAISGANITLSQPLQYAHTAKVKQYAGVSYSIDMRAEVGLISSNVRIQAADGPTTAFYPNGTSGEMFGARVLVHDNGTVRLSNVALWYCGQKGLDRPCVNFDSLAAVTVQTVSGERGGPQGAGLPKAHGIEHGSVSSF